MDGTDGEGRRLGRLVTLVVALAVLAERAGRRSYPVRWFVLALLRHAEAVVMDFAAGATGTPLPCPALPYGAGSGPADAALLAARLRLLASVLRVLLPPDGRRDPRTRTSGTPRRHAPGTALSAVAGRVVPAFDTS